MNLPKSVSLFAVIAMLITAGCAAPGTGATPPIVDEDGKSLTPEQMAARLAEGGWVAEPQENENGTVDQILVRRSDSPGPPQMSGFAPPPGAIVLDDSTIFRDEDGSTLSFAEFEKRMSEGGWIPEPQLDENGNVTEVLLHRGDGSVMMSPEAMPEFSGGSERWQGSRLPDFKFKTLDGRTVSSQESVGRVTVVNFWFRGCKPCIMEIPELNELVEQFSGQDVDFLAFSRDPEAEAGEAVSTTNFAYDVIADSGALHDELGIFAYPTHLVFDREGLCVAAYQGYSPGIAQTIARDIQLILDS